LRGVTFKIIWHSSVNNIWRTVRKGFLGTSRIEPAIRLIDSPHDPRLVSCSQPFDYHYTCIITNTSAGASETAHFRRRTVDSFRQMGGRIEATPTRPSYFYAGYIYRSPVRRWLVA